MKCKRCGERTPRLRLSQRYCPPCEVLVEEQIAVDERRRTPRFGFAKELAR